MRKFQKTIFIAFLLHSVCSYALTDQISDISSINSDIVELNFNDADVSFNSKDIKEGMKSDYVSMLQQKFNLPQTGVYDKETIELVTKLQYENGLSPSGVIDKTTWIKIYGTTKNKFENIKEKSLLSMNEILEKDSNKSNKYMAVVNIPSQMMYLYKKSDGNYDRVFESKVIVGRPATQTPLVDFDLISVKYNPTWTPTQNMLKRNVYKGATINVAWLKNHHLKIYDENGEEQPYENIKNVTNPRFVQELGEYNALGNLKFETSSKDDIYLHDTNERHIFKYNQRTYSSGCIRVQNYKELASILLDKNIDYINKKIDKRETSHERIQGKVPVYIMYSQLTSDNKRIQISPDVYNLGN